MTIDHQNSVYIVTVQSIFIKIYRPYYKWKKKKMFIHISLTKLQKKKTTEKL